MKLLYPVASYLSPLDAKLLDGFGVSLRPYDPHSIIPDDHVDADVLVAWGNSEANLANAAKRLTRLKWIQSLAAGPDDILAAGFMLEVRVTTGSGLHNHTVAEHALGLLLNAVRRFSEMRDYQLEGKWPQHLGGNQPARLRDRLTTLRGTRVLIWGFGNIANTLTPLLATLGASVRGVARSPGIRNGIEVVTNESLAKLLPTTDMLLMILPGSESTRHALNAERLKLLPKHAWVVNVGRGVTVDEDALFEALEAGEIGGAALDVFETEPLPADSKLWKARNLILSPHAAGGRPLGAEDLIARNLRRFLAGQELENIVSRT